ncbi:MAG TPA: hypothetical protein VN367_01925 [Chlorobaculum sp.]|nr:hypothetical protein [Chlorobaculum sp.]
MIPFLRPLILSDVLLLPVSVKPETGLSLRFAVRCIGTDPGTFCVSDKSAKKLAETGFFGRDVLKALPG